MRLKFYNWIKSNVFFGATLLGFFAFLYAGFTYVQRLPIGIHFWKQSMHFSMIQNYVDGTATFWHPAMNNLFNTDHTGKMILEFPIFHKFAAILIQIFPALTPTIFPWIILILTTIGLYHVYRLNELILNNKKTATVSTLLVFTIPIITFYGANYLVDVPALLFTFSTIYFLERNVRKYNVLNIAGAAFFILLSGLLRLPVLIPFIAYASIRLLFRKSVVDLIWLLPSLLLIYFWYRYVAEYNTYWVSVPPADTYGHLSPEAIDSVKKLFPVYIFPQLGWAYKSLIFYIVVTAILVFSWRKVSRFWITVLGINIIGSMIYFYLWFGLFNYHDYYLIPVLSNFVFIWINLFIVFREVKWGKYAMIICALILIINTLNTFNNFRLRIHKSSVKYLRDLGGKKEVEMLQYLAWDNNKKYNTIREISPYNGSTFLADHGITSKNLVICDFDYSPTYALSLLQLKGWSAYNSKFLTIDEYKKYVDFGAEFLICDTATTSLSDSSMIVILKSRPIFSIGNIEAFDIRHLKTDSLSNKKY